MAAWPPSAELNNPIALAFDASGDLFIADESNNVVREVTTEGIISTYAGTHVAGDTGDGGQATAAELHYPSGLAFDALGDLYISDNAAQVVRKVTPEGVISTYAGDGAAGDTGDGGPATSAELDHPFGIAMDAGGRPVHRRPLQLCGPRSHARRQYPHHRGEWLLRLFRQRRSGQLCGPVSTRIREPGLGGRPVHRGYRRQRGPRSRGPRAPQRDGPTRRPRRSPPRRPRSGMVRP